ncbi:MAG: hypothetical protein UT03_C0036G0001, partial [Candidatus Moranbacteria bacterium GW2011_GWD2_38_7]
MKIGINASFLRKQNNGIGQVTTNFLKKLVEISNDNLQDDGQLSNEKNIYFIYLEEDVDLELPENFHKVIFRQYQIN